MRRQLRQRPEGEALSLKRHDTPAMPCLLAQTVTASLTATSVGRKVHLTRPDRLMKYDGQGPLWLLPVTVISRYSYIFSLLELIVKFASQTCPVIYNRYLQFHNYEEGSRDSVNYFSLHRDLCIQYILLYECMRNDKSGRKVTKYNICHTIIITATMLILRNTGLHLSERKNHSTSVLRTRGGLFSVILNVTRNEYWRQRLSSAMSITMS